jgi:hypothetical protein
LLISRNPLPLHEFKPLQLLVAVLHELSPLQELAPMHLPFSLPAWAAMGAVANMAAAAIARAAPVVFFTLIMFKSLLLVIVCIEGHLIISQNIHKSITPAQVQGSNSI